MHSSIGDITKRLFPVLLAVALGACQETTIHRFCAVESHDWQDKYKARFHITEIDKAGRYEMTAEARLDKSYCYKDLWMVVETKGNGTEPIYDTICIETTDRNGDLDGSGRSILEYQVPLRTLQLKPGDTLDICMKHIMKVQPLSGVHDIGLKLELSE